MEYIPDKWLILKFLKGEVFYKVFATWSGGYANGDEWKLNSGITKVEEDGDYYLFYGYSGSVYRCHKNGYGSNNYGYNVINSFAEGLTREGFGDKIEVLDDCNWIEFFENKLD